MNRFLIIIWLFSSNLWAQQKDNAQQNINNTLNQWHKAAAEARFDDYFNVLTNDAIFIGTDATENWNKQAFKDFSKPYFDRKKAWHFEAIQRNIYLSDNQKMAWFDELLSTQMKICRGSGVLLLENGQWKIKHYVLSMTIPNDKTNEVVALKSALESELIHTLTKP